MVRGHHKNCSLTRLRADDIRDNNGEDGDDTGMTIGHPQGYRDNRDNIGMTGIPWGQPEVILKGLGMTGMMGMSWE